MWHRKRHRGSESSIESREGHKGIEEVIVPASDGITISVIIIIGFCVSCISAEMEELAEGVGNITLNDTHKKNRIQVSNTKKPLFFYVNLAKRYMQQHEEVELSALGMAIATVVTVAEILKNNGLAVEKRILTSTVDMKDEARGRPIQKAKVEIILAKADRFDELMDATTEERELVGDADEQS